MNTLNMKLTLWRSCIDGLDNGWKTLIGFSSLVQLVHESHNDYHLYIKIEYYAIHILYHRYGTTQLL